MDFSLLKRVMDNLGGYRFLDPEKRLREGTTQLLDDIVTGAAVVRGAEGENVFPANSLVDVELKQQHKGYKPKVHKYGGRLSEGPNEELNACLRRDQNKVLGGLEEHLQDANYLGKQSSGLLRELAQLTHSQVTPDTYNAVKDRLDALVKAFAGGVKYSANVNELVEIAKRLKNGASGVLREYMSNAIKNADVNVLKAIAAHLGDEVEIKDKDVIAGNLLRGDTARHNVKAARILYYTLVDAVERTAGRAVELEPDNVLANAYLGVASYKLFQRDKDEGKLNRAIDALLVAYEGTRTEVVERFNRDMKKPIDIGRVIARSDRITKLRVSKPAKKLHEIVDYYKQEALPESYGIVKSYLIAALKEQEAVLKEAEERRLVQNPGLEREGVFEEGNIDSLKQAVSFSPDYVRGWIGLGLALHRENRLREARFVWERVAEIATEPRERCMGLNNLGAALLLMGHENHNPVAYYNALGSFTKAYGIIPSSESCNGMYSCIEWGRP